MKKSLKVVAACVAICLLLAGCAGDRAETGDSAAAFMITGPATKITNLGALKIAMGWGRFVLYILFVMLFSFLCGMVVNLVV